MAFVGKKRRYGGSNNNYSRGGFQRQGFSEGPPEDIIAVGKYTHSCEGELVVRASISKIPYFNAKIYLENKAAIGKVSEIFGPINDYSFSVKLDEGYHASSISLSETMFIDPAKLLPLSRFMPPPPGATKAPSTGSFQRGESSFNRGRGQGNRRFSRFGSGSGGGAYRGGRGGFRGNNNGSRGSGFRGRRARF